MNPYASPTLETTNLPSMPKQAAWGFVTSEEDFALNYPLLWQMLFTAAYKMAHDSGVIRYSAEAFSYAP